MRREDLGPVKDQFPSVGECHDREARVGGLVSRRRRNGTEGFSEGKWRKRIKFEMKIKKKSNKKVEKCMFL